MLGADREPREYQTFDSRQHSLAHERKRWESKSGSEMPITTSHQGCQGIYLSLGGANNGSRENIFSGSDVLRCMTHNMLSRPDIDLVLWLMCYQADLGGDLVHMRSLVL